MPDQHSSYKAVLHRHDVQLAGIIVVMAVIFSTLSKSFLSAGNLVSLLENYSVMAIMAAGLLVVLISGGIDISFAAIAAVSQYVMATVLIALAETGSWPSGYPRGWHPARGRERSADLLPPSARGHRHHFDDDLLFRAPHVRDRWQIPL
jgi:hypothetical protein